MLLSTAHRNSEMNCRLNFLIMGLLLALPLPAMAQEAETNEPSPAPPSLSNIMSLQGSADGEPEGNVIEQEKERAAQNGVQIRNDALREAGLSFGARGGLAYRTFEVQRRLAEQETYLSRVYDFNRLLIPAQNGLLIEPPIVSEGQQALIIKPAGQEAATADRVLKINRAARIVSAARNWRTYLERDWGKVEPPPTVLLPRDKREKRIWQENLQTGWQAGIEQADDVFQADLDRLTNDFVGMVRYRELVAQGMITAPYALAENRGITGNPNEMRIGDRGLEITGPSQFVIQSNQWQPTTR